MEPVLIAGEWTKSDASGSFHAVNPSTQERLAPEYPISSWAECERAIRASAKAAIEFRRLSGGQISDFLSAFASKIEAALGALSEMANLETALPVKPRLAEVEGPRTVLQLRLAAASAKSGDWSMPTIDTKNQIRSCLGPIGPVCVFGPNNFPFAYNGAAGGDFAAAIAAGNPVIAKANTSHPGTSKMLAELGSAAARECHMPAATIQLLYRTSHADGEKLVSHPLVGATGYTGSRTAGLKLKAAADLAGKPIYLELSSVNPVIVLPSALKERFDEVLNQFVTSALMATGQFCTNPGMTLLIDGEESNRFAEQVAEKYRQTTPGTLLSQGVRDSLSKAIAFLQEKGADTLANQAPSEGRRICAPNTLLRVSGDRFLSNPHAFQTEAFGNASVFVFVRDVNQLCEVIEQFEGNLTGSIYSATNGDEETYDQVAFALRPKVGRFLNDKMPTGVAVSPAMNHGGPYPATGHPGFTAVGVPASLHRFASLYCFDAVREYRLPKVLRDKNPEKTWRCIDGAWTTADV